jgi:HlyD family secretion protein
MKAQAKKMSQLKKGKISTIKYVLLNIFQIISFLWLFSGCSSQTDDSREHLIPVVEAVKTHFGSLPLSERLTGVVKAKNQVAIYPRISAAITAVYVNNGDFVKQGQALVKLRDKEFQDRLKQAKANYQIAVAQARQAEARFKEAGNELNRTRSLEEKGLASNVDLENAETQKISAEANLDLAKARIEQAQASVGESEEALSETVIKAAVLGTVGNRNAEIGMQVNPNTRLFTLGQLDDLKIEVILTDRMLNYINVGQRSEIISDYLPGNILEAPLTRISPFLHPVTHSTDAEIDLKNPDDILKPGMFVTVDVYYGESEQATIVPLSALYENPATGTTGVFVSSNKMLGEPISSSTVKGAIAVTKPVPFEFIEVDVLARGRMEAGINGVQPDDWVVTLGQNLLGSDSASARVHMVEWSYVEHLQNLQSQDLLKDIMDQQQGFVKDSLSGTVRNNIN